MVKTALVLSAGGMFGAYQAGVWSALEPVFRPDVVVGTSVGALNAWIIAGGATPDALISEWLDPGVAEIARRRSCVPPWRGVFDSEPLHERIRRMASMYRPRTEIGVVAVEWRRLRLRLFRDQEIDWRHLAASCAAWFAYRQVRIDGKLYTDGGLLSTLPVWAAPVMGAARVVAVNALPRMPSVPVRAVVRCARALAREPALPGAVELLAVGPAEPLGTLRDALFWNRSSVERWIEQGRRDASRALASGTL